MVRLKADYCLFYIHNAVGSVEPSHIFAQDQRFYIYLKNRMMLKGLRNLLLRLDFWAVLDLSHSVVANVQYD